MSPAPARAGPKKNLNCFVEVLERDGVRERENQKGRNF